MLLTNSQPPKHLTSKAWDVLDPRPRPSSTLGTKAGLLKVCFLITLFRLTKVFLHLNPAKWTPNPPSKCVSFYANVLNFCPLLSVTPNTCQVDRTCNHWLQLQVHAVTQGLPDQEVSLQLSKTEKGGSRRKPNTSVRFCSKVLRKTIAGIKFSPRHASDKCRGILKWIRPPIYLYFLWYSGSTGIYSCYLYLIFWPRSAFEKVENNTRDGKGENKMLMLKHLQKQGFPCILLFSSRYEWANSAMAHDWPWLAKFGNGWP